MNDPSEMFTVEPRTLGAISSEIARLVDLQNWLVDRGDREAAEKLMPILSKLGGLLVAIVTRNVPDIEPVFDSIEKVGDATRMAINKAETGEEVEDILCQMDQFVKKIDAIIKQGIKK